MKKQYLVLVLLVTCVLMPGILGCGGYTTITAPTGASPTSPTGVASTAADTPTTISTTPAATTAAGTWTDLNPGGDVPSPREGHSMVYDSSTGKVILFGGLDDVTPVLNDTWSYDVTTNAWTKLNPAGSLPAARAGHAMVWDSATGQVILFGGLGLNDTWAYDATTNAWTNLDPVGSRPSVRGGHAMVYDSATDQVILFGGVAGGALLSDTWAYDPATNTWTDLRPTGSLPSARLGHSMVYDSSTGKVILFGGLDESVNSLADTWAYDPVANTWTKLSPAGDLSAARDAHSMVYDSSTGKVILFGGTDEKTNYNDTWAYDPVANTWTELSFSGSVPFARSGHSTVYDSATGQVILFGGQYDSDTWAFNSKP